MCRLNTRIVPFDRTSTFLFAFQCIVYNRPTTRSWIQWLHICTYIYIILYIIHVLYIWYILCTQKWKKMPSWGWQNQHFNYTLCSITLQRTTCTYIQFWKSAATNHCGLQRQGVDVVGYCSYFNWLISMFVFDILEVTSGCTHLHLLAIGLINNYPIFAIQHCIITKAGTVRKRN
jgi:hypothetical protein